MSAASASSLILPSLGPKTVSLSNPKPISLPPFSLSHRLSAKPLFCSAFQSFELLTRKTLLLLQILLETFPLHLNMVKKRIYWVVITKGLLVSPDLKLFVGNFPFSVDSAQLAGLFGSARNVQMVEVIYDKVTG